MLDTIHRAQGYSRRRGRGATLAVGLAAFALVAACAGGGNGTSGGTGTGGEGARTGGPGGDDAVTSVTAQTETCPSGTPGAGKPQVRVGSKNFAEQFLLGELYSQALRSRGYTIDYRSNIGGSEVIDRAFQADEVDMYPEYLGEIETSIADFERAANSPEETFTRAKQFEEAERNATILPQTPFQNTDVLIVKPAFAQQHNLKAVRDLNNVGPQGEGVTLAAQPPFETRFNGLVGMKEVYGLTAVKFNGVDVGLTYQALDQDNVNVADAFSTDGQLSTGNYVTLDDPENIFGFQHVAPVIKQPVLQEQGPEFAGTLNCVSTLLTTEVMRALNAEIQLNGRQPAEVAEKFLTANRVLP